MKKTLTWSVMIIAIVLVILGLVFFLPSTSSQDKIVNGWWNEATQECWTSQDHPPGDSYPVDESEGMFASCCFNDNSDQVDCNDPTKIIGSGTLQAIYGAGGQAGVPGIFYVVHTITLTNDGSVVIDNSWVDSATWTPSHAELTTAYAPIIGQASSYAGDLPVGNARDFPTGLIDLRLIAGEVGSPITYDLELIAKASAYGGELNSERQVSGQIIVEKESLGFSIDIGWGA